MGEGPRRPRASTSARQHEETEGSERHHECQHRILGANGNFVAEIGEGSVVGEHDAGRRAPRRWSRTWKYHTASGERKKLTDQSAVPKRSQPRPKGSLAAESRSCPSKSTSVK